MAALRCVVCRGIISGKTGRERVRVSVEDVEEGYALGPPIPVQSKFSTLKVHRFEQEYARIHTGRSGEDRANTINKDHYCS